MLEGPVNADDLYLARGAEVGFFAARPLFTGDVLELTDGEIVALLQHPCSMRVGRILAPQLIVARVADWKTPVPSDWTKHAKRMFLPEVTPGKANAIEFVDLLTISAELAEGARRRAILSQRGVNLLLQRWVHHLTRVIVPTSTLHESIAAEHEEAELIGEEVGDLIDQGLSRDRADELVEDWLDHKENGRRRRALLRDPQARSGLRRELRAEARTWVHEHKE